MSDDDDIKEKYSTNKKKKIEAIKVVVVGSSSVGKTCLINRYITNRFLPTIPSTCGTSFIQKKIDYNKKKYVLNIWDTAGEERYGSLTKIFTKKAQIVILVYSIELKKSFDSLNDWLRLIQETNDDSDLVVGIAANKSDLYLKSKVPDIKGKEYAKKINAIWKPTSALEDDQGIDLLIEELLGRYIEQKNSEKNKGKIDYSETSFYLNPDEDKKKKTCCGGGEEPEKKKSKKKKNKNQKTVKKVLIEDDKGSISILDDDLRSSIFSERLFADDSNRNSVTVRENKENDVKNKEVDKENDDEDF